jgi:hypothetical protein
VVLARRGLDEPSRATLDFNSLHFGDISNLRGLRQPAAFEPRPVQKTSPSLEQMSLPRMLINIKARLVTIRRIVAMGSGA